MKSDDTGPAYDFVLPHLLKKKSGYEAQQSPLFFVFVTVFNLDRAHTTTGFEFCINNQPIKLLLSYSFIV